MTTTTQTKQIQINIYRSAGTWFGARWIDGEYDGCDEPPVGDDADDAAATESALSMPLAVSGQRQVTRVDDVE